MSNLATELTFKRNTEFSTNSNNDVLVQRPHESLVGQPTSDLIIHCGCEDEARYIIGCLYNIRDIMGNSYHYVMNGETITLNPEDTFTLQETVIGGKPSHTFCHNNLHYHIKPKFWVDKEDLEEFVTETLFPALQQNDEEVMVQEELECKWRRRTASRRELELAS